MNDSQYQIDEIHKLIGGTITNAIVDDNTADTFGSCFVGLQVKLPNGTVKNAWIQADFEGNGPGFLFIENASDIDPEPKEEKPVPTHTSIDEFIDSKVSAVSEREQALINYLKTSAITDEELEDRDDFGVDEALRLVEEGVVEMWSENTPITTFYLPPVELCIDRIITYMISSRDSFMISRKKAENLFSDWKVLIDDFVIRSAIDEMIIRHQLRPWNRTEVNSFGTFHIPYVSIIFGHGIDSPTLFRDNEVNVLKALADKGHLSATELLDVYDGNRAQLVSSLNVMVGTKKVESFEEKRGRCKIAFGITKRGQEWLERANRARNRVAA